MFQEFFKDTLISRFIKRLLRSTNLPLMRIITQNTEIIKGCIYLYDRYIIECVKSGKFYVNPDDLLFPGNFIYPSKLLYPSDDKGKSSSSILYALGQYKILDYYDENNKDYHYNFHSKYMYYDSDTHYHLGEYLRYIRDRKGLNLFPYYNCFNNKAIIDLTLTKNSEDGRTFKLAADKNYKLYAIPVKFGETYTIAIDSDTPIQLRSIIYNEATGCVVKDINTELKTRTYYSDDIDDYELLPNSTFTKPFLKTIPLPSTSALYAQEKNLYLILQVSIENKSAITVLEGNYIDAWNHNDKTVYKNLSLLHFNSHTSYAFSDRLIEYLLLNVIDKTEELDGNIIYAQNLLSDYKSFNHKGIWTDDIKDAIRAFESKILEKYLLRDLDGYINRDIERCLLEDKEE